MVKNQPSSARETGSIPGRGTKIPHAEGQLRPHAATTEAARSGACAQLESPCAASRKPVRCKEGSRMLQRRSCMPQLRPTAAK